MHKMVCFAERMVSRGYRNKVDRDLISDVDSTSCSWLTPAESHVVMSMANYHRNSPGEMAEVGVSAGSSAKLICEKKGDVPLHLFDTFDGLPKTCTNDEGFFEPGMFRAEQSKVEKYLSIYDNVHFHPGLFPATGDRVANKSFSFVFLDVDLYESTRNCLEFFGQRMIRGGTILSHDYQFPGVKKAFRDTGFESKTIELADSLCMIPF